MAIKGVIFDLDGVIVSTDEYHCKSWFRLGEEYGIYFDRKINNRLRGLSRSESLEIFLETTTRSYSDSEKKLMESQKNQYYLELLNDLSSKDILPGVVETIGGLKSRAIKLAIGSSSKNCPLILERIGLSECFDACVDGNQVSCGKPNPEIFLKAAQMLGLSPLDCLVIEDGKPGIEAARAAGMKVVGVGRAVQGDTNSLTLPDLSAVDIDTLLVMN